MRLIKYIMILTAFFYSAQAQPDFTEFYRSQWQEKPRLGIFGGFDLGVNRASFSGFYNLPSCCPEYVTTLGTGFSLGGLFEMPLNEDFTLNMNAGYKNASGRFTSTEKTTVSPLGTSRPGEFEHRLDYGLSAFFAEPGVSYYLTGGLKLNGGMRLTSIAATSYTQWEEITQPDDQTTFLDADGNDTGSRIRNQYSGEIPSAGSFLVDLVMGISYELPMNNRGSIKLVPELSYGISLLETADGLKAIKGGTGNGTWKHDAARAGISLRYSPFFDDPKIDEKRIQETPAIDTNNVIVKLIEADTVHQGIPVIDYDTTWSSSTRIISEKLSRSDTLYKSRPPILEADIQMVAVDDEGREFENAKFLVEEFVTSRTYPIINYIFFEENSEIIPDRYKLLDKDKAEEFFDNVLFDYKTLDIYYNLLNILGRRMINNPQAKVTLTGLYNGYGEEKGNRELPQKRAENIKHYLTGVWGIEPDRLRIDTKSLANEPRPDSSETDKIEELRRVEIISNDYSLLMPVHSTDTIRNIGPQIARFKPDINAEVGVKNWAVTATQSGNVLKTIEREQYKNDPIDWNLAEDKEYKLTDDSINYKLEVTDKRGTKIITDEKSADVELVTLEQKRKEKQEDYVIDKYSLILFDFNKYEITDKHIKIIDFIKNRIEPESEVYITGYADRIGEEEYNIKLSELRAKEASRALGADAEEVKGVGGSVLLYDNELPEGRFYCRTVEILIRTPVNNELP